MKIKDNLNIIFAAVAAVAIIGGWVYTAGAQGQRITTIEKSQANETKDRIAADTRHDAELKEIRQQGGRDLTEIKIGQAEMKGDIKSIKENFDRLIAILP